MKFEFRYLSFFILLLNLFSKTQTTLLITQIRIAKIAIKTVNKQAGSMQYSKKLGKICMPKVSINNNPHSAKKLKLYLSLNLAFLNLSKII